MQHKHKYRIHAAEQEELQEESEVINVTRKRKYHAHLYAEDIIPAEINNNEQNNKEKREQNWAIMFDYILIIIDFNIFLPTLICKFFYFSFQCNIINKKIKN